MKFTLLVTQECNLACSYCYITKRPLKMALDIAKKTIDFIYAKAKADEKTYIAFFGGEPLLEFSLIKEIVNLIESHPRFRDFSIEMSLTTNGTIFSDEIADFLNKHRITYCLSCDGPAEIQDKFRVFKNGDRTSIVVENTIQRAKEALPIVLVNAVYSPPTLQFLPQTVNYFAGLGIKQIYLNADYSAAWTKEDAIKLDDVFNDVSNIYINSYKEDKPLFINLLDGKIAVILRGGYQVTERCQMGRKEFAFAPDGNIFPCERIVEDGQADNRHCIGTVTTGIKYGHASCNANGVANVNKECKTCGIREYCMNWCGCSNFHATGFYNKVGAFMCAEEKAVIRAAYRAYQILNHEMGITFFEHLAGNPMMNIR